MQATAAPPPRRSLKGWAVLAILLIVFSYVFTVLLAAACTVLPYLLMAALPFNINVLFLLIGGVLTSLTILWSLAPRRQVFEAPGPPIERAQSPRLFAELDAIAGALHEPMPEQVYLIPDVNAFVAEHGGAMGFGARRIMALGLPLMRVLSISQFRAVIAHEFGHYYSGDTNLGPWIYRTRLAMYRTLVNLRFKEGTRVPAAVAVIRMLVMTILGGYWKVFLRITFVVSRKQEFRADELACWLAGPQPLIDGLCAIDRAAAAGQSFWQTELSPALQAGYRPPVAEGFALFLNAPHVAQATAAHLATVLNQSKSNMYDTHPPLRLRVAAARTLPSTAIAPDNASSLSLVGNVDALELQLLQSRFPQLRQVALRPVSWEQVGPQIYIPSWRRYLNENRALLAGLTVESLPEAVHNTRAMGSRMPDPKGMLLTHEQRAARAATLLGTAFSLALIDNHWELHAQPGEHYLQRGDAIMRPAQILAGLQSGQLTADTWRAQCISAGIAGLQLDGTGATGCESGSCP